MTPTEFNEWLSYDPETGGFTWKKHRRFRRAGERAGTKMYSGYIRITFSNVQYLAHRLAFLAMTGAMPSMVDHKNRIRSDNRWCNLRIASNAENMRNMDPYPGRRFKGASWDKRDCVWLSYIDVDCSRIWLGRFRSEDAAARAYDAAAREHFGEFARPNFPMDIAA